MPSRSATSGPVSKKCINLYNNNSRTAVAAAGIYSLNSISTNYPPVDGTSRLPIVFQTRNYHKEKAATTAATLLVSAVTHFVTAMIMTRAREAGFSGPTRREGMQCNFKL